ncbi:small integral membrane protein 19 isoform X1 [Eublepharis macularius]|uniref:Small integral membrane protein 19 isoform X1 n=1 Tax=Eublepharis macularius TaxID=481883 RepID=A0AA97JYJ6_EUBMA|nr:small integral membrane protein 19 isoform X1 [Eublepharis macularius]
MAVQPPEGPSLPRPACRRLRRRQTSRAGLPRPQGGPLGLCVRAASALALSLQPRRARSGDPLAVSGKGGPRLYFFYRCKRSCSLGTRERVRALPQKGRWTDAHPRKCNQYMAENLLTACDQISPNSEANIRNPDAFQLLGLHLWSFCRGFLEIKGRS